jgi:uncharacterized protein
MSETENKPRKPRGFAALMQTPEGRALVSEIARKGGKAAHVAGTAHEFSSDEAREAGRRGGKVTHARRREAQASGASGAPVAPDSLSEASSSSKVAE